MVDKWKEFASRHTKRDALDARAEADRVVRLAIEAGYLDEKTLQDKKELSHAKSFIYGYIASYRSQQARTKKARCTLKKLIQTQADLQAPTLTEARRLLEIAKAHGIKTTIKSIRNNLERQRLESEVRAKIPLVPTEKVPPSLSLRQFVTNHANFGANPIRNEITRLFGLALTNGYPETTFMSVEKAFYIARKTRRELSRAHQQTVQQLRSKLDGLMSQVATTVLGLNTELIATNARLELENQQLMRQVHGLQTKVRRLERQVEPE